MQWSAGRETHTHAPREDRRPGPTAGPHARFRFDHVSGPRMQTVSSTCKAGTPFPGQAGSPCGASLTADGREMNTKSKPGSGLLHRAGQSPELKFCLQFKVIMGLCVTKEQRCPGPARVFIRGQGKGSPAEYILERRWERRRKASDFVISSARSTVWLWPWAGGSVGERVTPVRQGCMLHPWSGHT